MGDVEVGVLLVDQLAERRVVVVAVVGDGGKARRAAASDSAVVPGRGNCSWSRATVPSRLSTGIRLVSKRPSAIATGGAGLRLGGEGVERLAGSMPSSVAIASAHTPWCDCGWISWRCSVARAHRQQALLRQRHHLGAAADHEVLHARHDRVGRDVGGGDARAAEAVEGHAAGPDVVAGVERRHPPEVAALLAHLRAGAPDHVVDIGGVEVVALGESLEHGAAEVLGVQVRQSALALLADATRGPAGVDDQCVRHGRQHGASTYCRDGHRGKLEP
jgi:hypothetical protein